jgi:predicted enzyme related to lactoylglutathione lyase
MLKYTGYLIVVEEMAPVKSFYVDLLQLKPKVDSPEYVVFEGEFCLFLKKNFQNILGDPQKRPIYPKPNNGELYFETDEIESFEAKLMAADTEFIHKVVEQPWGQRVMRVYDPAGTIVEVGETMAIVIRRYLNQGLTLAEVSQKVGFPEEMLKDILGQAKEQ